MTSWSLTFVPERTAMFAQCVRVGGVNASGHLHILVAALGAQRGEHTLRREWRFVQSDTNGIMDRIRDSWDGRRERTFAGFFRAEWAFGVDALDDEDFHHGRLDVAGRFVFEHGGVHQKPVFPDELFLQCLTHAHPYGADDLAFDGYGIERASAIVRCPDFVNGDF